MRLFLIIVAITVTACTAAPHRIELPSLAPLVSRHAIAVVGVGSALGVDNNVDIVGSGFFVHCNVIVTAGHVARTLVDRDPIAVWLNHRWKLETLAIDTNADLALMRAAGVVSSPKLALADDDSSLPGDWVLILGRPFGRETSVTVGIVSALPGAVQKPPRLAAMLQINAAINAGNSGGPVIDLYGKVVGISTATVPGGQGLGFAVPVAVLRGLLSRNAVSSQCDD